MYCFGINFEFDKNLFYNRIYKLISIKKACYICVVDANVLTISTKDNNYRNILNASEINCCDGSSIAAFAGFIYGQNLKPLTGPEIFQNLISDSNIKHVLVGNSKENIEKIKLKMISQSLDINNLVHIELPFSKVDEFDYISISKQFNEVKGDIYWISLGAPKQELFMSKILPYLNSGIMFGIGAAFNFYIDEIKMSNFEIAGIRFNWLNRIVSEPLKIIKRILLYLVTLPFLIYTEIVKKRKTI